MLTLLLASFTVSLVSSREECTENLSVDGYFELDETDCTFCFCICDVNTATGDVDCGYDCSISFDPNAATVDSLEMVIQYCGLNCGAQEVLYDDSTSTAAYCSCDRISCDGDDDDDSTPKPTRNTDPDDPDVTEDKQTQRPVVTTVDNGDDSDDTRVTDDPDDPNDPDPTTDADRVTKEPDQTEDDGDNSDPDPTRDDNDDSDDNNTRVTDDPEPTRDDSDDSDEPQETKVDDDSDSDDDNDRETPTPTERKYDDDYDLSSKDEDDFLDDDDVDVIDSDDDSKPYLVTEFKFTLTKVWYYRPDFDSILKRAIRILLALSEDYDDDAAARYIIKFEADRTDDDDDNDETKTTRTDESDDDTRTADNDDTDAATTADDGRGRRLLEDNALNTADSDSTREPQTTKGDNGGTSVIQTDPATEPEETRDSSDSDDDYRTTVYIDDKCDDVTLSIYVGIAVYIDDIDVVIRLYNWLLSIGNTLGDEFAIYCEDSAVLYRECGWGEVDVYYASVSYYDETGALVESETYDGGDDDGPSGTSNANIANVGISVMVLLSALSLFNLW